MTFEAEAPLIPLLDLMRVRISLFLLILGGRRRSELLFSFCGSLPGMVYISRHELTEKEWWFRTFLHYVLLNVILLPLTQLLGLWCGMTGIIVFAVIIMVVDALVHGLSFGLDWILARDVNLILSQERRMEQGK